ncbi:hypothetical protein ACH4CC_01660 [Streptomyces lydicus]|uniref:hypothetical protein n=1 Tax=Streptomyces lydicus TaxID=47763 RepID=UPI0037929F81
MADEIRNMFFKSGLTGSIFGSAPPIWQELDFKSCADGSIRKVSASPVLRSSYMPNQYLYRNGKAINLDGTYTQSSNPVTTGDFYHFSVPPRRSTKVIRTWDVPETAGVEETRGVSAFCRVSTLTPTLSSVALPQRSPMLSTPDR